LLNARKGNPISEADFDEVLRSYDRTKTEIDRLKELPDIK